MGNFRIVIDAVGGHGCDRRATEGEALAYGPDCTCPDCTAYRFVQELRAKGWFNSGGGASLTHWPGESDEVVDDLLHGVRAQGRFQ